MEDRRGSARLRLCSLCQCQYWLHQSLLPSTAATREGGQEPPQSLWPQRAAGSSPLQVLWRRGPRALLAVELGIPAPVLLDAGVLPDQQWLGQVLFVIPDGDIPLKLGGKGWSRSGGDAELPRSSSDHLLVLCELSAHRFDFSQMASVGQCGICNW